MAKPKSFKENLVVWRTMVDNLAPQLDRLPRLRASHASLTALLDRAAALQAEQAVHAAKLRQVNRERAAAAREGRKLRNYIALSLQHELGESSERLIEFGVKPRARRRRRNLSAAAEGAVQAPRAGAASEAAPAGAGQPDDGSALS